MRASSARLACVFLTVVLAVAASALITATPVRALPGEIKLRAFDIEAHDKITEVLAEDLDGDGRKDLLLLLGREVRIYFQREAGGFPAEPDQRFRIDPRAVVMDLGDVLGDGTKQIAFIRDDGVYAYPMKPAENTDSKPYFELRARRIIAAG